MNNKRILILALLFIAILISSCVLKQEFSPEETVQPQQEQIEQQPQAEENTTQTQQPMQLQQQLWQTIGIAIQGTYADAEIAELGDGYYRMYYSIEPEVPGNELEIFSSISTDGINWRKEEETRKEFATFPDVVKLPDGRFRMYFQNAGVIKSAISQDGLVWNDEASIRIDKSEVGFDIENVGAQTTMLLDDGTYIMIYRGTINQRYALDVPNSITSIFFYATSNDGINFEKKGIALDSRNSEFKGWLDGPEWVKWDNDEVRLYFWSYKGIYYITYKDGIFSKDAVFDFTTSNNPLAQFPENPPGDPTLAKISDKWFMYYGQHTKGIYYTTSEQQQEMTSQLPQSSDSSNELSIPSSLEDNCVGFLVGIPQEIATINLIGAGWTRPHPGPFSWGVIEPTQGSYDFGDTDDLVKTAQQNNVLILGTIWPFAKWDQEDKLSCKVSEQDQFYPKDPRGRLGIPPYRCKPSDMQAYRTFLSELVERYDGDGENDMPSLKIPIKYWEILNEPEMKSSSLTFFMGDENDYVEVLKESYQTIKQRCPDCSIVHGGAAGTHEEFLSFWDKVFELGAGNYFDIANIHSISTADVSDFNVNAFKSVLDKYNITKPIWVTEVEFRSEDADVKTSTQNAMQSGASKIFFVSFNVGGHTPPAPGEYSSEYKEAIKLCPKTS